MVVTVLNAAIWQWRSRPHIARDPSLADGYRDLTRGMALYGNIPWIVMGVGVVFGGVPSVRSYFRPQDMNPYVLAFLGSIVLLWILGSWWLFARGGAEMMARHPGLLQPHIKSPQLIKAFWGLCMLGGVIAVIIMFRTDIPVG